MSFISVFDVLGPNMIGPSSSHTAGAAVIVIHQDKVGVASAMAASAAVELMGGTPKMCS